MSGSAPPAIHGLDALVQGFVEDSSTVSFQTGHSHHSSKSVSRARDA